MIKNRHTAKSPIAVPMRASNGLNKNVQMELRIKENKDYMYNLSGNTHWPV